MWEKEIYLPHVANVMQCGRKKLILGMLHVLMMLRHESDTRITWSHASRKKTKHVQKLFWQEKHQKCKFYEESQVSMLCLWSGNPIEACAAVSEVVPSSTAMPSSSIMETFLIVEKTNVITEVSRYTKDLHWLPQRCQDRKMSKPKQWTPLLCLYSSHELGDSDTGQSNLDILVLARRTRRGWCCCRQCFVKDSLCACVFSSGYIIQKPKKALAQNWIAIRSQTLFLGQKFYFD